MMIKETRGVKRTATDCVRQKTKWCWEGSAPVSNEQAGECQERIQWRKEVN